MKRQERIEELIRQEVSEILRTRVFDPRIGFVSITGVRMSSDLRKADIFVSVFAEEKEKQEVMEGLYSATGFIQRELAARLQIKNTPKLKFVRDDSLERGSKVLGILSRLEHEKGVGANKKAAKKG
jgi:ribosome-binding factor A